MINSNIDEILAALNKIPKQLEEKVNKGTNELVDDIYNDVIEKCVNGNLSNHLDGINKEHYVNGGRIYSDDPIIIFNEMGTGVVGSNSPKPTGFEGWKYDVNEHGEAGWKYPKKDGTFGWTKGIPAKTMFYTTYLEYLSEKAVVKLKRNIGDLY